MFPDLGQPVIRRFAWVNGPWAALAVCSADRGNLQNKQGITLEVEQLIGAGQRQADNLK